MSTARLRRLLADWDRIQTEFVRHPHLRVRAVSGSPPERFEVTYLLKGLRWDAPRQRPVVHTPHIAEIYLHQQYPREKPKCTLRTEIFHPNFGPYICIGDHWAAGESLVDVIIKIGEMIQYQDYNVKSPLNGLAAKWTREHEDRLPIGSVDLYLPEPDIVFSAPPVDKSGGAQPGPRGSDLDIRLT